MVNSVVLVGRLTKDIELRKTPSGISSCKFTLACDKRFKPTKEGAPTADFIPCIAWRQQADFLANYAKKGGIVAVEGSILTGNFDGQDGKKVYTTEVQCDRVRLIGGSRANTGTSTNVTSQTFTPSVQPSVENEDDFSNTPSLDITSDDLPFY